MTVDKVFREEEAFYESRRRQVLKRQEAIQWVWVAVTTIAMMVIVAGLGKITSDALVNPLKAKQLAGMIANPDQGDDAGPDARGEVSAATASLGESLEPTELSESWGFGDSWDLSSAFVKVARAQTEAPAAAAKGDAKPHEQPTTKAPAPPPAAGAASAQSGDPMSSQTIIGDVLEYIMMTTLYILFGMAFSGVYVLWTVRRANFYVHEDHVEFVERVLLRVFRGRAHSPIEGWNKLRAEEEELAVILDQDNHLAEITHQIGVAALTSQTALDRYFINQTKDIREEEAQKLHLVSTALNVAPAVGFAGTVQGMIVAFSLLGENASPEMINMMSQGIFVALVTTFMALLIKAVGLSLKSAITQRINFFTTQMQMISSEVSANLSIDEQQLGHA